MRPPTRNLLSGFTIVELLITIAIISILASVALSQLGNVRQAAFEARAQAEMRSFGSALQQYLAENNGQYPPDENRDVPPGLEEYLGDADWPSAPWPGSVYDWDNWEIDGDRVIQLSIRFCPQGGPLEDCSFPGRDWADDFDVNSAYFYCFEGDCQSHDNEPREYPGYCMNCDCQDMAECYGTE